MSYFLVLNPGSRGGKSETYFEQILEMFNTAGVDYDYQQTAKLVDAYHLSYQANQAGYDTVVAVGGDGTINQVINGFYNQAGQRLSQAKLGVIHTGTSPDFNKSYGLPLKVKEAVQLILEGQSRKIKIGQILLKDEFAPDLVGQSITVSDQITTKYFGCCANIGLGAQVARQANSGIRKIVGDTIGTFLALLQTLYCYQPSDFIICQDGEKKEIHNLYNLAVGKTFYIASGIKVNHQLDKQEQQLYNLLIQNIKFWQLPQLLKTLYSGQEIENNNIIQLEYGTSIEIYGNEYNPEVECDGDPIGYLPCKIKQAEEKLDLLCDWK